MTDQSLAKVGDVIEHGQAIPANVVRFNDSDADEWRRVTTDPLRWTFLLDDDPVLYEPEYLDDRPRWWPLTVVEVDPEPQPAERRLIGPPHAHLDAPCTDACYEPAGDNQLDVPEPVLLNLVRQYGAERESTGGYTPDRGELQREKAKAAIDAADNLFGRIATLVGIEERDGLQVIAERDENAEWADRLAQAIAEFLHTDIGEHSNHNLPWQAALAALTDAVSPLPTAACSRCRGLALELAATQQMLDVMTAPESGPVVLSLPQVPRKDVTLVGRKGTRFVPVGGASWQAEAEGGRCFGLGELIDLAGPLTVEFAPPREPRVWEQLDPGTDDLQVVECLGMRYTRGSDSLWYGDRTSRTWLQLRAMGEVREVLT